MASKRRVSDFKDPVIVWDGSRSAYWKSDGNGYVGSPELAGIWERSEAPKDPERKFEYFILPSDHIQILQEQLAEARKDAERLDWIEREAKGNVFEWVKIYPIARIVGANPNAKDAHETLRAAIDAAIDAARQKEGK